MIEFDPSLTKGDVLDPTVDVQFYLAEEARSGNFWAQTMHHVYAAWKTETGTPLDVYTQSLFRSDVNLQDDAHAAVLTFAAQRNTPNGPLIDAAFRSIRQPGHAWEAAVWASKQGVSQGLDWSDRLGKLKAEAQEAPHQAVRVVLAELDMNISAYGRDGQTEQSWRLENIRGNLSDFERLLTNAEAFNGGQKKAMRLKAAQVLGDAGWPSAARRLREPVGKGRGNDSELMAVDQIIKPRRGASRLLPWQTADPSGVAIVPERLTFVQDFDDRVHDVPFDIQQLLRAKRFGEARSKYGAMFCDYFEAFGMPAAYKLQATTLMHYYHTQEQSDKAEATITPQLEGLHTMLAFPAHAEETERGNAREAARKELTKLTDAAAEIASPRSYAQVMLAIGELATNLYGTSQTRQDIQRGLQKAWVVWGRMLPSDAVRSRLAERAIAQGVKVGCLVLKDCGDDTCKLFCDAPGRE
jgi:hypothetical protein